MDERKVSDRETLHKQMELLAERSKSATERELADLTAAMCEIHRGLSYSNPKPESDYYKCGLLKWSKTPILSRVSLLVSAFALVASLLVRCKTG